jgi:hypothetical protein
VTLLADADEVIRKVLYIEGFAEQEYFFRRVRLPPLMHVYWDCIFCTSQVRKLMRHFVNDHEEALKSAKEAMVLFARMEDSATAAGLPLDDICFMKDSFEMMLLARRFYYLPWSQEMVDEIKAAKKRYKQSWPRTTRQRYRIKTDFEPFRVKRRTLRLASMVFLRKGRGYRLVDHLLTLNLLALVYRIFKSRARKALPKFVRKSAMGIDSVLR